MIVAVLDANVIVSGFPAERGATAEVIERWLSREFRVILSEHSLDGVERAWNNPWFRDRYARHDMRRAIELLRTRATFVVPAFGVEGVAADQEDDRVLATAIAGNAAFLVTGDRRFRDVGRYGAVTICSPREFVQILDRAADATPGRGRSQEARTGCLARHADSQLDSRPRLPIEKEQPRRVQAETDEAPGGRTAMPYYVRHGHISDLPLGPPICARRFLRDRRWIPRLAVAA